MRFFPKVLVLITTCNENTSGPFFIFAFFWKVVQTITYFNHLKNLIVISQHR